MNSLHEATFPVSFRVLLSYHFSVMVVTKSIFNHAAVSHDFGRTFYRIDLNRVNKPITNHKIGVFCENTTSITSKRALKTANFACFPAAIFLNIQTCCIVGSVMLQPLWFVWPFAGPQVTCSAYPRWWTSWRKITPVARPFWSSWVAAMLSLQSFCGCPTSSRPSSSWSREKSGRNTGKLSPTSLSSRDRTSMSTESMQNRLVMKSYERFLVTIKPQNAFPRIQHNAWMTVPVHSCSANRPIRATCKLSVV